jgi:hypothetical protein
MAAVGAVVSVEVVGDVDGLVMAAVVVLVEVVGDVVLVVGDVVPVVVVVLESGAPEL